MPLPTYLYAAYTPRAWRAAVAAVAVGYGDPLPRIDTWHTRMHTRAHARTCTHLCPRARRWVIFNDEKVAVSEHPPRDLGYLYLFKRADAPAEQGQ